MFAFFAASRTEDSACLNSSVLNFPAFPMEADRSYGPIKYPSIDSAKILSIFFTASADVTPAVSYTAAHCATGCVAVTVVKIVVAVAAAVVATAVVATAVVAAVVAAAVVDIATAIAACIEMLLMLLLLMVLQLLWLLV